MTIVIDVSTYLLHEYTWLTYAKGAYARNYLKIKMLSCHLSFFITSGEYDKKVVKKCYNGKVNWHFEGSYYMSVNKYRSVI
jgi:hypothetical protein